MAEITSYFALAQPAHACTSGCSPECPERYCRRLTEAATDPAPLFERAAEGQVVLRTHAKLLLSAEHIHRDCVGNSVLHVVTPREWEEEVAARSSARQR